MSYVFSVVGVSASAYCPPAAQTDLRETETGFRANQTDLGVILNDPATPRLTWWLQAFLFSDLIHWRAELLTYKQWKLSQTPRLRTEIKVQRVTQGSREWYAKCTDIKKYKPSTNRPNRQTNKQMRRGTVAKAWVYKHDILQRYVARRSWGTMQGETVKSWGQALNDHTQEL